MSTKIFAALRWAPLVFGSTLLVACGGGSGDGIALGQSNTVNAVAISGDASDASSIAAIPSHVSIGYSTPPGTLVVGSDVASNWKFSSQNGMSVSAGAVGERSGAILLSYDFGCQTPTIVTRTQDCRNIVTARNLLPKLQPVSTGDYLSFYVRNPASSANISLLVWDTSGQVLRYPVRLGSLADTDPNNYTHAFADLSRPSSYWNGANNGVIQGSITAIAITASPFNYDFTTGGVNYPAGEVEFKEFKLHSKGSFNYHWQPTNLSSNHTARRATERFAISVRDLKANTLNLAQSAGFNIVRRDVNWEGAEQNGSYSFASFTEGSQALAARGMKALWILAYGHSAHGGSTPLSTTDQDAYASYAKAAASIIPSATTFGFEIWNEPESELFWPSPNANVFSQLVAKTTTAIKTIQPGALVITGGVTLGVDSSFLFTLGTNSSQLLKVDGIGIHNYRKDTYSVNNGSKRFMTAPEELGRDLLIASNVLKATGVSKALYDTEGGYSSAGHVDATVFGNGHDTRARERQAKLVLRRMLTQIHLDAKLVTLYSLLDDGVDPLEKEHNFGLFDASGNAKPAYQALAFLKQMANASTYTGYLKDMPPHGHGLNFTKSDGKKFSILWADHPDFTVNLTLPQGAKAFDYKGNLLTLSTVPGTNNLSLELTEANGPVYVTN